MVWAVRIALAAIVLARWFYLTTETRAGGLGFRSTTRGIHAESTRNVAQGHGLSFSAGEPSTDAVAPLWT